jgi:acyl carrier protein
MVPSSLQVVGSLPLTANGKVDRRALPAPVFAVEAGEYVAPETETEIALAAIWAGILGIERVGRHDQFFELGGHSLLATRAITAVRAEFGLTLKVRDLFEHQTVVELSAFIDILRSHAARTPTAATEEALEEMEW